MNVKFKSKKTYIIYAPGVFTGGGLILLKLIIRAIPKNLPLTLFLDKKIFKLISIPKNFRVFWIKKSLFSRLYFEYKLFTVVKKKDIVLTFTSLPPLFKLSGYVISYHQNSILLEKTTHKIFSIKKELQFIIKRIFSLIYKVNIQEYIVQTISMKKSLKKFYGNKVKVRVLPFIKKPPIVKLNKKREGFLYVADGNDHKNHNNLLEAWSLLGKYGIKPKLFLTLDKNHKNLLSKINNLRHDENLKIYNLGEITHYKVFKLYKITKALIFPSFYESFGLPLIEASQIKLPIIASDLKYVREVCDPDETFNPQSPYSIMKAVIRFLNKSKLKNKIAKNKFKTPSRIELLNEKDFLRKIGIV